MVRVPRSLELLEVLLHAFVANVIRDLVLLLGHLAHVIYPTREDLGDSGAFVLGRLEHLGVLVLDRLE